MLIGQWHHHDQLNRLAQRGVPIVVWGTQMPQQRYCCVGGDNVAGGLLATRHLLQQGCRRIAFVGDPQPARSGAALPRPRGRAGKRARPGRRPAAAASTCPSTPVPPAPAWLRLCDAGVAFDAVFACSDVLAMAAVQALRSSGRTGARIGRGGGLRRHRMGQPLQPAADHRAPAHRRSRHADWSTRLLRSARRRPRGADDAARGAHGAPQLDARWRSTPVGARRPRA